MFRWGDCFHQVGNICIGFKHIELLSRKLTELKLMVCVLKKIVLLLSDWVKGRIIGLKCNFEITVNVVKGKL